MPHRHRRVKAIDPSGRGKRKNLLNVKEEHFNQAPKNVDDQEVPRSLRDMMTASEMASTKRKPRVQKVGTVERMPNEDHDVFMRRVGYHARQVLHKVYSLRDEAPAISVKSKKELGQKTKDRLAILQNRIKGKKFEKKLQETEKDFLTDHVQFGEVVSRPPVLTAQPRKSANKSDKAGQRQLLLKSAFESHSIDDNPAPSRGDRRDKKPRQDGKIKRRKNMTNSEKRRFDKSRSAAILAYRKVKGISEGGVVFPVGGVV